VKLASFEAIVRALNEAGVRYLVAGGLAVNAHGCLRRRRHCVIVRRQGRRHVPRPRRIAAAERRTETGLNRKDQRVFSRSP
jgi:hypothetical protein